ncbi:hypothetical protein [Clostridium felsineum]|uniref:Uncharacterized protein n=1 Tax=Clostridium felsineum TaxID=36839 RepID=A0A1S8KWV9_9CLOT|nr:hypothetical protein [Clostridium felsineum]URZ05452.1 hypothetical protein CLROS_007780 [Clostridium felsineum]URZ10493.1 hypothetical protein CROST_012030 [Clostridium felsineum]
MDKNYCDCDENNENNEKKVKDFINSLEHQGCIVQEGELRYIDILKYCSEGLVNSALGNNAGAPYALALVPPSPNQESDIEFITEGVPYKLRPDEAIVLIGKTPPKAYYYSFRSFLFFVKNKIGKYYSDNSTVGNDKTGKYHMIFGSLGDTINNYTIKTENTPDRILGYPYDSSTIIITTADQYINHQIRKTLINSGFSSDIMNNDNIPKDLVNMGLEKGKDTFAILMRASIWENKDIGQAYLDNLDKYWHVLRITPKKPIQPEHPWPIPTLKMRETCKTEFNLLPHARYDLNYLRYKILEKYDSEEYEAIDLRTNIWVMESFEAIMMDVNVLGESRDALYLKTNNFQLTSDDDFIITYGVNHTKTGNAVYYNSSFYGAKKLNGVSVIYSPDCEGSANEFFPKDSEVSDNYYVYKMARKGDGNCTAIIPYSTGNPKGSCYGVNNYQEAFIGFRLYLNQETLVGPAPYNVIWDQAILFRKKKSTQHQIIKNEA